MSRHVTWNKKNAKLFKRCGKVHELFFFSFCVSFLTGNKTRNKSSKSSVFSANIEVLQINTCSAATFETLMQSTPLFIIHCIHFWKGNDLNNPFLASNLTTNSERDFTWSLLFYLSYANRSPIMYRSWCFRNTNTI